MFRVEDRVRAVRVGNVYRLRPGGLLLTIVAEYEGSLICHKLNASGRIVGCVTYSPRRAIGLEYFGYCPGLVELALTIERGA